MARPPPKQVFWPILRTTVLAWAVLRTIVSFYSGSPSILPPASMFLILGTALVALVDVSVSRERLILANSGLGRRFVAAVALLVSGTLEVAAALALRLLDLGV